MRFFKIRLYLEELGYLTKADPETLTWLEETYPELHKVVTAE